MIQNYFHKYLVDLIQPKRSSNKSFSASIKKSCFYYLVYQKIDKLAGLGFLFRLVKNRIRAHQRYNDKKQLQSKRELTEAATGESSVHQSTKSQRSNCTRQVISYKSSVDCDHFQCREKLFDHKSDRHNQIINPERSPSSLHTVLTFSNSSQFSRK